MRILYICTGNSFRSPAAEALTRKFQPGLEVESAGTNATDHIAENMKQLLEEENALQYVKPEPDQLSERAVNEADRIVCMMPEHRKYLENNFDVKGKDLVVWRVKDPIKQGINPEESFEAIKKKIL